MSFIQRKFPEVLEPLSENDVANRRIPSRYSNSGVFLDKETGKYFLGIPEPRPIEPSEEDTIHVTNPGEYARPDLISYRYYGFPSAYAFLLFMAGIIDPFEDIEPGISMVIPPLMKVLDSGIRL